MEWTRSLCVTSHGEWIDTVSSMCLNKFRCTLCRQCCSYLVVLFMNGDVGL